MEFDHEEYGFKIKKFNPPIREDGVIHEATCELVFKLNMNKIGEVEYRILGPGPAEDSLDVLKELRKSIDNAIDFLESCEVS